MAHTCIVCFTTPVPETRTAFRGSMRWLKAALVDGLGLQPEVAASLITENKNTIKPANNPNAPMGLGKPTTAQWWMMAVCLCPTCAALKNFDVGTEASGEIPCYEEAWKR